MKRKPYPAAVSLRPGFFVYVFLLLLAVILAQWVHTPEMAVILALFLSIAPVMALYAALSVTGLRVICETDRQWVARGQPVTYRIRLKNRLPLALGEGRMAIWMPEPTPIRCGERQIAFLLRPFETLILDETCAFPYRGVYPARLLWITVSDLFGLYRLRVPLPVREVCVTAFPGRLGGEADPASDARPREGDRHLSAADSRDIVGLRDYQPGDAMNRIHWKLSAKAEDPVVKVFGGQRQRDTVIFCDLSGLEPETLRTLYGTAMPTDITAYAADALCSYTVTLLERAGSEACTLILRQEDGGVREYTLTDHGYAGEAAALLAAAPVTDDAHYEETLRALCRYRGAGERHFILITARMDRQSVSAMLSAAMTMDHPGVTGSTFTVACADLTPHLPEVPDGWADTRDTALRLLETGGVHAGLFAGATTAGKEERHEAR